MYHELVRQRLTAERKAAGYSQQQLADEIQELRSKIAKIENGSRAPDVDIVGKLAEFYGISTDWLYGLGQKRPNEPPPKQPSRNPGQTQSISISQHM